MERCNEQRARKGLPPLTDALPPGLTPEMAEANLARAAQRQGLQKAATKDGSSNG